MDSGGAGRGRRFSCAAGQPSSRRFAMRVWRHSIPSGAFGNRAELHGTLLVNAYKVQGIIVQCSMRKAFS